MLYLGIDLHRKQLTVSLRNKAGDVILRRQVSARRAKVEEFLKQVHELEHGRYVALLEVCGFHDWLVQPLRADARCQEVVLLRPEQRSRKKTDPRDANRPSGLR